MSDNKNNALDGAPVSIWPTVWKYALIIAAFKAIYSLVLWTTGLAGTPGLGLIGIVVSIVLLVIALRSYRSLNAGHMTFGQAFGIAFVASIVSTAVRAAVDSVYLATLGQARLAAQLDGAMSQLQGNPAVDAQTMNLMRGFFEVLFTPAGLFIGAIIGGTIGWAIVSLILAAILKKPPPITG